MAMPTKYKVFVSRTDIPPKAIELLETKCDVTSVPCTPTNWLELWGKYVHGMEALFIQHFEKINVKTLDMVGSRLRVVATMSVHHGNIDLEECRRRGIHVGNTPHVQNDAVAEVALALTIMASRRIAEGFDAIRAGNWTPTINLSWMVGPELVGKVAGVIGLGDIGMEIVNRLRAFKVRSFLYHNRRPKLDPLPHDIQYTTLKHLLCNSDIVIVCCPLNADSQQMFNEKTFHLMKHTAVFVSISRREVVNEEALCNALKSGVIASAALDAAGDTPMAKDNPLLKLPNCIITPNMASDGKDAKVKTAVMCAENILAALEDKYHAAASLLC
ncbi:glyoxylate reductase/hydroxypyruvate reductase-like [Dermacentor andersoni]|uniref:glyoxylate reductase/hydroxypyruvate reductase-like n=1 Tax=Dermacentor andersoni TaxID=34620 RepID=UPI00241627ED|nr:glyoxylate reductase/hydroxypyruvate reductase-like [Dermacentor andersoni]